MGVTGNLEDIFPNLIWDSVLSSLSLFYPFFLASSHFSISVGTVRTTLAVSWSSWLYWSTWPWIGMLFHGENRQEWICIFSGLASCLYYHSKWLAASLLLLFGACTNLWFWHPAAQLSPLAWLNSWQSQQYFATGWCIKQERQNQVKKWEEWNKEKIQNTYNESQ